MGNMPPEKSYSQPSTGEQDLVGVLFRAPVQSAFDTSAKLWKTTRKKRETMQLQSEYEINKHRPHSSFQNFQYLSTGFGKCERLRKLLVRCSLSGAHLGVVDVVHAAPAEVPVAIAILQRNGQVAALDRVQVTQFRHSTPVIGRLKTFKTISFVERRLPCNRYDRTGLRNLVGLEPCVFLETRASNPSSAS